MVNGTIRSGVARSWLLLAGFIALCLGVSAIGGLVTRPAIPVWYAGLAKPAWTPPDWLFTPVWLALFILMGAAAWLVSQAATPSERARPLALFGLQLGLNLLWSVLFFKLHQPLLAAFEIGLLWLAILACWQAFRRISPLAGWLLVPYLAWVAYAAALNVAVVALN